MKNFTYPDSMLDSMENMTMLDRIHDIILILELTSPTEDYASTINDRFRLEMYYINKAYDEVPLDLKFDNLAYNTRLFNHVKSSIQKDKRNNTISDILGDTL
jgi:hypothetical protein